MDTKRCQAPFRIKLLISYDGTDYAGWQKQAEGTEFTAGRPTIQSTVEAALSKIFNEPVKTVASGRTDAGVHAEAQVVHFDAPRELGETNLVRALNKMTPPTIGVLKAWSAPADFHALFSAEGKTYRYVIHNKREPSPLTSRFATHFEKPLDLDRLNALAEPLIGEHDFKSFQTSGTQVKTTVRTVREAHWFRLEDGAIEFRITGTGFLKQMVRNIVGTLLYLHQNHGKPADMQRILQSLDRQAAKTTAPPEGLHLHAVYYPPELDNQCREL